MKGTLDHVERDSCIDCVVAKQQLGPDLPGRSFVDIALFSQVVHDHVTARLFASAGACKSNWWDKLTPTIDNPNPLQTYHIYPGEDRKSAVQHD